MKEKLLTNLTKRFWVHQVSHKFIIQVNSLRWADNLISFLSNIPKENRKEFSMLKMEVEEAAAKKELKELSLEDFLEICPSVDKLYMNPLRDQFEAHFKSVLKLDFNPANK